MLLLPAWLDLGAMAMKGYSVFPKAQHNWNLTIRSFSVISRTLVRGSYSLKRCNQCIAQPTGQFIARENFKMTENTKNILLRKVLSCSWRVFWYKLRGLYRMEVVWKFTSKHGTVSGMTWGLLAESHLLGNAYTLVCFLLLRQDRKECLLFAAVLYATLVMSPSSH